MWASKACARMASIFMLASWISKALAQLTPCHTLEAATDGQCITGVYIADSDVCYSFNTDCINHIAVGGNSYTQGLTSIDTLPDTKQKDCVGACYAREDCTYFGTQATGECVLFSGEKEADQTGASKIMFINSKAASKFTDGACIVSPKSGSKSEDLEAASVCKGGCNHPACLQWSYDPAARDCKQFFDDKDRSEEFVERYHGTQMCDVTARGCVVDDKTVATTTSIMTTTSGMLCAYECMSRLLCEGWSWNPTTSACSIAPEFPSEGVEAGTAISGCGCRIGEPIVGTTTSTTTSTTTATTTATTKKEETSQGGSRSEISASDSPVASTVVLATAVLVLSLVQ